MGRCQRGTITPQCASNLIPDLTCDSHVKRKKEHRVGTGIQWGQSETLVTEIRRIYEPSRFHLKSYNFSPPCLRTNNSLKNFQSLQRNRVHHKTPQERRRHQNDEENPSFHQKNFPQEALHSCRCPSQRALPLQTANLLGVGHRTHGQCRESEVNLKEHPR